MTVRETNKSPTTAVRGNFGLASTAGVVAALVGLALAGRALLPVRTELSGQPRVKPAVPVTAMDQTRGVASNSPVLLADPTNTRFIVVAHRVDAPDFSCGLQVSGDAGRGWVPVTPVEKLPDGAEKCYAPEVAFDSQGVLYYLFVGLQGVGNEPIGAFLTTSRDRAQTWSDPRPVLGPLNFGIRMAIDPTVGGAGRLHLTWIHATSDPPLGGFGPPPNPILASYSDDGGATFSDPVQVSDPARLRVVAPALALGPDRAVHVAYYDLEDDARDYNGLEGPTWEGTWSLVLSTSTDGGHTFSRSTVIEDSMTPSERVMLVFTMPPATMVADREGRVCAAWPDARNGDSDVLARCSIGKADKFGPARRVNDDRIGNGSTQYLPRLSTSPGGRLDIVFYDRRDDRENVLNSVYYAFLAAGGDRFSPNVRLTPESFESRLGQRYVNVSAQGQVEFGSRIGLLSRGDAIVAAWTDTGNSKRLSGTTGQDIFATEVGLPTSRSRTGLVLGAIVATSGLLLAFVSIRQRRGPSVRAASGVAAED